MTTKKRARKQDQGTPWKPNKTALVTGASGGIGFDLASLLAQNSYNVVLVARSTDKLKALAHQAREMFGVSAKTITKDLSDPSAPEEIFRELKREGIEVDILVNNAGYGLLGGFAFSPKREELAMTRLNVLAPVHLTKLFLAPMIQRRNGHILNVASTAGFQASPLMANYSATKAYMISFTVALAQELRETGVSASVLCPGSTATGFHARAGIRHDPALRFTGTDSRVVARAGYEGMMAGKTIIVPGVLNKIGTVLGRLIPINVTARVIGNALQKRKS